MARFLGKHSKSLFNFGPSFEGDVRRDEPMSRHTTYRIGGPARYYVTVLSVSALNMALAECRDNQLPWTVVGQGSNLLVADEGYPGAVLTLAGDFKAWKYDPERMRFTVGAGMSLSRIVQEAFHLGVSGLEFAVGTPGTVGGALRMNAGTKTEWLSKQVATVTTFSPEGGLKRYHGSDLAWGYRMSSLPADEVIVECELNAQRGADMFIRGKMEGALARRKKSQPLNHPSCGSVFCNPEGDSAGRLIEELGMKGYTIGGAQISEKHANFIVNVNGATAADVASLIKLAHDRVLEAYGIDLVPEVRFLGFA